jgi:hypothetical protein
VAPEIWIRACPLSHHDLEFAQLEDLRDLYVYKYWVRHRTKVLVLGTFTQLK